MIKAVIFDLDGTLGDTVESIAYSANLALAQLGYPGIPTERFRYYAGDGVDELVRRCLVAMGDVECGQFEKLRSLYKASFSENCMYHVKPYDGICAMLDQLKEKGVRIAVLSNKPHAQAVRVVEELFGTGYFDRIQGQTARLQRKPAPDGALALAEGFGILPQECLYVGDTNTDMQTARAAQMHAVGVLWGFRERAELEENGSEFVIEYPWQLPEILERVGGKV